MCVVTVTTLCVVRVDVTEHSGVEDGSSEVHGEPPAPWSVCDATTRCFVC